VGVEDLEILAGESGPGVGTVIVEDVLVSAGDRGGIGEPGRVVAVAGDPG